MTDATITDGKRRAVCVGINKYNAAPLHGCVADAQLWAQVLQNLGFEAPTLLTDELATRQGILDALGGLIAGGEPGDVLVFQYAGHGTQVPDLDGDEEDDGKDEALVPVDYEEGKYVIDDDIWEVLGTLPEGVNLTVFLDCCHSGSGTRAFGFPFGGQVDPTARRRFMVATREMEDAHRAFREGLPASQVSEHLPEAMKWVNFSACQPHELAWESGGQGDFTRHATGVLGGGPGGFTHEEFQASVIDAFGASPRQRPYLDCAPAARLNTLLAPIA